MPVLSSFGVRLVVTVLATVSVCITLFAGLSVLRLEQGLERQTEQLERLSEIKLDRRLSGVIGMTRLHLDTMAESVESHLWHVAQRYDVREAVDSRNVVAMFEVLGEAMGPADVDGIVVVDTELKAIGASDSGADLLAATGALAESPIGDLVREVLARNDPADPAHIRRVMPLDEAGAQAVTATEPSEMALIIIQPVFDDFGDVQAALVARRSIRMQEQALIQLANVEQIGVVILSGTDPVTYAGLPSVPGPTRHLNEDDLFRFSDSHWSRCSRLFDVWTVCALAEEVELSALRDEMVSVFEAEARDLILWMLVVSVVALTLCGSATMLAARYLTGPLARITEAVREVARGNWKADVIATDRRDEIGEIARAVVVLQQSLEERDKLRTDVATIENADRHKESLQAAIQKFDHGMRTMLLTVVNHLELMDETSQSLAVTWSVAEGEADEATFVSERTVGRIESVSDKIAEIETALHGNAEAFGAMRELLSDGTSTLEGSEATVESMTAALGRLDAFSETLESIAKCASLLAINATFTVTHSTDEQDLRGLASEASRLSNELAGAAFALRESAKSIRVANTETSTMLTSTQAVMTSMCDLAVAIGDGVERQKERFADTRSQVSLAADGSRNVNLSVSRLKGTVVDARSSSLDVQMTVNRVAEEARRFDGQLKQLLRSVAG